MQAVDKTQSGWLSSRVSRNLFAVAVLSTCGLIMAMDYADPDLWGHVLYGQEILRDGTLPTTTTWSFTANGYRWINHENVAELVMAFAVNQFGPLGLTIGKYLFGWALLGLIWWRSRAFEVSPSVAAFTCFVIAFTVQFHWHFRPQIFGYVLFGVMCALLFWCFHQDAEDETPLTTQLHRLKYLFWLAPLAMLWTNTHGSFAAGIAISSAFLGLKFIEIFIRGVWKQPTSAVETISAKRSLFVLIFIVQAMLLCTLANPYGIELHQWLLGALKESRPEIGDWESPSLFSFSREVIGLWVMIITTAIAFKTAPRKDWAKVIVFLLIMTQAISHIRHLPLLAIMWGSWFTVDINRYWKQFVSDIRSKSTVDHLQDSSGEVSNQTQLRPILIQATLCLWILGAGTMTWSKLETLNVPRDLYPVDALKFMADHRLEGRTVVTFNWAQYAIGVFENENLDSTVAFDGRFRTCYPQEVIDIYFDFIFGENYKGPRNRSPKSAELNSSLALNYKDPEFFLISKKQQSTVKTMEAHNEDWGILYEDHLAQIWGRRSMLNNVNQITINENTESRFESSEPAAWPAFASGVNHSKSRSDVALKD